MSKKLLQEYLNPNTVDGSVELLEDKNGKNLYMKGIFMQGNVKNANQRVYPAEEIRRAVNVIKEQIQNSNGLPGEIDHPADLKINLDRISHIITDMWMEGFNGMGKLKIINTPSGNIIKAILEAGVKLGVSTRGSGNVDDSTGQVSDFEIITVDVVAQPSAPNAYPTPIFESLLNMKHGYKGLEIARDAYSDSRTQKYLKNFVTDFINDLRVK